MVIDPSTASASASPLSASAMVSAIGVSSLPLTVVTVPVKLGASATGLTVTAMSVPAWMILPPSLVVASTCRLKLVVSPSPVSVMPLSSCGVRVQVVVPSLSVTEVPADSVTPAGTLLMVIDPRAASASVSPLSASTMVSAIGFSSSPLAVSTVPVKLGASATGLTVTAMSVPAWMILPPSLVVASTCRLKLVVSPSPVSVMPLSSCGVRVQVVVPSLSVTEVPADSVTPAGTLLMVIDPRAASASVSPLSASTMVSAIGFSSSPLAVSTVPVKLGASATGLTVTAMSVPAWMILPPSLVVASTCRLKLVVSPSPVSVMPLSSCGVRVQVVVPSLSVTEVPADSVTPAGTLLMVIDPRAASASVSPLSASTMVSAIGFSSSPLAVSTVPVKLGASATGLTVTAMSVPAWMILPPSLVVASTCRLKLVVSPSPVSVRPLSSCGVRVQVVVPSLSVTEVPADSVTPAGTLLMVIDPRAASASVSPLSASTMVSAIGFSSSPLAVSTVPVKLGASATGLTVTAMSVPAWMILPPSLVVASTCRLKLVVSPSPVSVRPLSSCGVRVQVVVPSLSVTEVPA